MADMMLHTAFLVLMLTNQIGHGFCEPWQIAGGSLPGKNIETQIERFSCHCTFLHTFWLRENKPGAELLNCGSDQQSDPRCQCT